MDGGHKDKEDKYGDSILDALKIARTQLNCSFYNEDGKDVITDLMRSFVNPQKRKKPHCYKYVLSALSYLFYSLDRTLSAMTSLVLIKTLTFSLYIKWAKSNTTKFSKFHFAT